MPRDWKTWNPSLTAPAMPVIPLGFVRDGAVLRYFSMVTSVGAPQNVAAQELRLECMFPADEETEARHQDLLAGHSFSVQRS